MVSIEIYGLAALAVCIAGLAAGVTFLLMRRGRGTGPDALTAADLDAAMARLEGELGGRVQAMGERFSDLSNLFVNDRTRGTWGELTLRRVLEQAGLRHDHDFELQAGTDRGRPDAVVHLPGGRKLVIDAKFPLARLSEALAHDDDQQRAASLKSHAGDIVKEARGLVSRGYRDHAAGGFVVMYLPHEALYVQAMDAMPTLYETLLEMRVILAGPSTLFALLSAAGHVIAEAHIVTAARDIVDEARELRGRLATFAGHLAKVGRGLGSAVAAYNGSVGSWTGRVVPQANAIAHHAGLQELGRLDQVDASLRTPEPTPEHTPLTIAG